MGKFGAFEIAIAASVVAAGAAVGASAAMAAAMEIEPEPVEGSTNAPGEIEISLPSMPATREEAVRTWVQGYVQSKDILSKLFRFSGQMFVAPIVVIGLDKLWAIHEGREGAKLFE